MIGLMVFPYVDSNPLGNGYYTLRQRRFAVNMFNWGFLMWILLIVIGTFIRGPGWIWFWPGQTWDHNTVVFDRNRDFEWTYQSGGFAVADRKRLPPMPKAVAPLAAAKAPALPAGALPTTCPSCLPSSRSSRSPTRSSFPGCRCRSTCSSRATARW